MTTHYYSDLPPQSFWSSGVAKADPNEPEDFYQRRWNIQPKWKIGAAGSCFAQHITRYLSRTGYRVFDAEPAPDGLIPELHNEYGYSLYSARYGNLYTSRQLLQLVQEAFADTSQPAIIWKRDGRYFDARRPGIEPGGFETPEILEETRRYHLSRVRYLFESIDMFIFTFGLTEAWVHKDTGQIVPIAPGVMCGDDEVDNYKFLNLTVSDVVKDFKQTMALLRKKRGDRAKLRYILTVSPVPLTATASGRHVLQATVHSKSVLRAAAAELYESSNRIDYFPSFEIVTNPSARGHFFDPNLRTVRKVGVQAVMRSFFAQHPNHAARGKRGEPASPIEEDDPVCEEAFLEAMNK